MYKVYLDDLLLPVTPSKIQMKAGGQNKKINLINGEEINVIRPPGLLEISFDSVIPQSDYPFAVWDGSFQDAGEFIERLREWKENGDTFEFVVLREGPGGREFHDTNIEVTLEDYKVTDDVKEGFDITVSLTLKEYKAYGTRIMNFILIQEEPQPTVEVENQQREGKPEKSGVYEVKKGDCLWSIAKKHLGNGSRYTEIYDLNRDKIQNPNLIYPGQILTMP